MRTQDIAKMRYIIEQKLEDEECTAIDLAAAFLRDAMGEELKDIVVEKRQKHDKHARHASRERDYYSKSSNKKHRLKDNHPKNKNTGRNKLSKESINDVRLYKDVDIHGNAKKKKKKTQKKKQ